jgi:cell division septation protein DedD
VRPQPIKPEPARTERPQPASGAQRFIQVAATPYADRAEELAARLRKQGFSAYVKPSERLYRVRLRAGGGAETLELTLERLQRLGHSAQILRE